MARFVLLDSGPLGLACSDPNLPAVKPCLEWLDRIEAGGSTFLIPAIADFEVRRELLRVNATAKLRRLAGLHKRFDYLEITREALDSAAGFWADLRRAGRPTASSDAIDGDAILAGMAIHARDADTTVIVATSNLKHLSRFPGINALTWASIA